MLSSSGSDILMATPPSAECSAKILPSLASTILLQIDNPRPEPPELRDREASFTTIELKTNFLGSARDGETIFGRATPAHLGKTTQVRDVEVRNQDTDRTIALFRCTQMILEARPS